ncbi:TPA: AAA family ATPase [Bacillus cereus]
MSYPINEILLIDEKYRNYEFLGCEGSKRIQNLSKVNIFVGANNSGKSRMLRELFQEDDLKFIPSEFKLDEINNIITEYKEKIIDGLSSRELIGYGTVTIDDITQIKTLEYIIDNNDFLGDFYDYVNRTMNFVGKPGIISNGSASYFDHEIMKQSMREISTNVKTKIEQVVGEQKNYKFQKVYIPTLRGLRGFESNENYYLNRTKKDYFHNKEVEIFTGLDLYEEVKKLLLGSLEDREKIADFQRFLGDSFFDGQEVTLIPYISSDVLYVKIGEEREYPIYELGDGIQSLIILTFPLYKYRNENLLLFIEEPELYLHPGMQRKFLEILMSNDFDGFQYFITSHSNHFLDITLDMEKISIYSFGKELETKASKEKNANFTIQNVSNEENNVLQMLGVRNSAVLLSNCTIWVEGITDRFYIRRFLKVFQESQPDLKQFKEDIHYSFVEYSGGNITHWSFLDDETETNEGHTSMNAEKICSTLFLITDKDGDDKRLRQQKLEKFLGDRYYCLECREIENILSEDILREVIAEYEKSTSKNEKSTSKNEKSTPKNEKGTSKNEKSPLEHLSNKDFTQEDYKTQPLGTYIDSLFSEGDRKRRGSYAAKSGTIVNKLDFCKRSINHISKYDQLSEEAKKLSRVLYEFIKKNNE